MKFVEVDSLPEIEYARKNDTYKHLDEYLGAFMKRNVKIAKVVYRSDEYATLEAAYICVRRSCKSYGYPISVHKRNGELYVVRKDI